MEDEIAPLLSLASIAGGYKPLGSRQPFHFTYSKDLAFNSRMPKFNFGRDPDAKGQLPPDPVVDVSLARIDEAAYPWKTLAAMWRADPFIAPPKQGSR